jgi:hypothetical protein
LENSKRSGYDNVLPTEIASLSNRSENALDVVAMALWPSNGENMGWHGNRRVMLNYRERLPCMSH